MKSLFEYTNYLKEMCVSPEEAIELLKECEDLTQEEKNIIYLYCYPRNLGDMELPARIQNFRQTTGRRKEGSLQPDGLEAGLLVEAYRTEQYQNFMKHIMIAFGKPEKIKPVAGMEQPVCPICGKVLMEKDLWEQRAKDQDTNQEYLAFGSVESSQEICKDCMVQLLVAGQILSDIEPDYLKRWDKKEKYITNVQQQQVNWETLKDKLTHY